MAARHQTDDAPPQDQARPRDSVEERIIKADRQSMHKEHELLGLVVCNAHVLDAIGEDMAHVHWTGADAERIAAALQELPHTASPAECFAAAQGASDAAAQLLSSAMSQADGEQDMAYRAGVLVRSLRERDLERQIAAGKARLREGGADAAQAADELFEETTRLQRELADLRRSMRASDTVAHENREAEGGKHED